MSELTGACNFATIFGLIKRHLVIKQQLYGGHRVGREIMQDYGIFPGVYFWGFINL